METFTNVGGKPTITKDPNAVLDYVVDYTDWLATANDTIASVACTPSGVTVNTSSVAPGGKKVVIWVAGGVAGSTASVTARITTVGGRIDDRTIYFKIKQR